MSSGTSRAPLPSATIISLFAVLSVLTNAAAVILLSRTHPGPERFGALTALVTVNLGFTILVATFGGRDWVVERTDLVAYVFAASLGFGCLVQPFVFWGLSRIGVGLALAAETILLARIALRNVHAGPSRAHLRTWIAVASLLVYAGAAIWLAPRTPPEGDEPHYLLATHSLVADHDLDLNNNYRKKDYLAFFPGALEERHAIVNRRNQDVPIHDVGLSILLVPGYAAAGRLGAMIELCLFGALLALGIYDLSRELGATPLAGARAWAFLAFTSPLVVYSSQIYPEILGCACCVWSVAAFARFHRRGSLAALVVSGALLAILPWLSVRYWLLVAPLGLAMAISAMRRPGSFEAPQPVAPPLSPAARVALLASPGVLSMVVFALFDLRWYQTPLPNAGYVLYILKSNPPMFSPQLLDVSLLGLLFDRAFGLLPTAPAYVIALAGAISAWKSSRWIATTVIAAASIFFLFAAANQFWYGGWAPPPRYIVPAVALLAPLASLVLEGGKTSWIARALVAGSALVAILYTAAPETRTSFWDLRPGALSALLEKKIGIDYETVLPSFIRAELRDYLLMLVWAGAAALGAGSMLRGARNTERPRMRESGKPPGENAQASLLDDDRMR